MALTLYCSSNLSPRCLLRLMQIMPWVLHMLALFSRVEPLTYFSLLMSYGVSFLHFGSHVAVIFTSGAQPLELTLPQPFLSLSMAGISGSFCWFMAHISVH